MNTRFTWRPAATAVLAAASWLAGPALAQTGQMPAALDMRASRIVGMDVHNMQGRDLGEINDLMIDVNNQRVHYAILGFGGFMGLGEKLFAYPVRSLRSSGDRLLLDVRQDVLERAPGFERANWPDWNDTRYREQVDRHFGPGVALERPRHAQRLMRASDLIGMDVNGLQGDDAGEVEDLVVNLGSAKVRYAVLDFDEAWSADDRMVPLPLATLRLPAREDQDATLQVPRDKLDLASAFDEGDWPDLNDRQYRDDLDRLMPAYRPWIHTPNQVLGADPPRPAPAAR
ncbi:MAG: hypothetical protein GTN84_01785 [Hydrogenophaga sp.]|uniref:PRC-barrel domain-containing protein n=1 Tax=Hydrogenophaga sp. TaxID=1904254 RepID=UPI001693877F|nr:PRC-barrel domain-containing protein [Hydrogenophaga sp.]NIM39882.1 hypothetical protein [Hydrogenophaga sp.]NIN25078.1 hypothetical protein [Hydrogenophaga sp.]NIN29645.1 hypothetical protein [Hydrogenophaga sp.]NIN54117.1 hypothetical protein [Hydrogenophaga sp.]NIO50530.1 hypothetical protein [Hydrogenophaga sp.]